MRKYHGLVGAALIGIAASTSVGAQAPAGPGILGFFDPASGSFQAAQVPPAPPQASGPDGPSALVTRQGAIRFKVIIKVLSGSPAATLPSCSLSFSHNGVGTSYNESQGVVGTRTGNDALCDLKIFYNWSQANNANPVNLSIFLSVGNRSHSESLPAIPLPVNGATTVVTVHVTA